MNKSVVLCAGLCVALAFTSCKSQESAYKKAYLKAQANSEQPTQPAQEDSPVVAPIETKTATETTVVDNMDNVSVRSEDFTVVSGPGVKNFSVVVGSFSLKANAEGLQRTLNDAGRTAQIVYNSARGLYRVVASTFDSKADAASSRDQLRGQYPDAWLLYKK